MNEPETQISCEEFAERLADYVEHDLDDATRDRMESHADRCPECGSVLADIRTLQIGASKLPELAPSRDLWSGIANRIETPVVALNASGTMKAVTPRRRWRAAWTGLAAAGLVAVTATVTYELTSRSQPRTTTAAAVPATSDSQFTPVSNRSIEQRYDVEIKRLREIVTERSSQLDPATVAIVDKNLKVIDDAIAQCKEALRSDPSSGFLIESLNDALETKVQLLRKAATLPTKA
jgi:hypothetical protein